MYNPITVYVVIDKHGYPWDARDEREEAEEQAGLLHTCSPESRPFHVAEYTLAEQEI